MDELTLNFKHIVVKKGDKVVFALPHGTSDRMCRQMAVVAKEVFGLGNFMVVRGDMDVTTVSMEKNDGREDQESVEQQ